MNVTVYEDLCVDVSVCVCVYVRVRRYSGRMWMSVVERPSGELDGGVPVCCPLDDA